MVVETVDNSSSILHYNFWNASGQIIEYGHGQGHTSVDHPLMTEQSRLDRHSPIIEYAGPHSVPTQERRGLIYPIAML